MSDLILDSLEIQNFRVFRHLTIDRLGRVNLIVGKNNVGKTTVLEALRLYSSPGSPDVIVDLLRSRDHFDTDPDSFKDPTIRYPLNTFNLFYQEQFTGSGIAPHSTIRIGEKGSVEKVLSISLENVPPPNVLFPKPLGMLHFSLYDRNFLLPLYTTSVHLSTYHEEIDRARGIMISAGTPSVYVDAAGLGRNRIELLWDAIALTSIEDDVIDALSLLTPGVNRLILKPIDEKSRVRVPFVKLTDAKFPVSLRTLGDGMNRIFGIVLALVNARDGLLLIDEIENGLHYSIQPDLWRLIFQTARRLNVQVFATTHSYDCIKAFEEAARESEEEGVLIRLAQKAGRTLVGEFDERELGIAVEGQIEVR